MTNVSISDINNFKRCRRKWDLESTSRQSLRTKRSPNPYLDTGSAVHEALDAQAKGLDPFEAFENYCTRRYEEEVAAYLEEVGAPPTDSDMARFVEGLDLARSLVTQYFEHYGLENPLEDVGLKLFATELSFKVPLREGLNFIGTFDGLATDERGKVWLVENKTLAQKLDVTHLQFSSQLVGYSWAYQVLTGESIQGVIYNGIIKKVIQAPKVLKSGALSVAKDAPVTLQSFLTALNEGGRDAFDPKYEDYIAHLQELGTSKFFVRERIRFSQSQLERWGNDLRAVAGDMAESPVIYPNFRREGCTDCWVRDLCESQELGRDVEDLKNRKYIVKGYGTSESIQRVDPTMVTSVEDLIRSIDR